MKKLEKNVIAEKIKMGKKYNVQRCVQYTIQINQNVEMEIQMMEKIVRHVMQIYEKSVQRMERRVIWISVEIMIQMNERTVKIVLRMCENVVHSVGMEKQKQQKIVEIVKKMCENVVQRVEMEKQSQQKIQRIVVKM